MRTNPDRTLGPFVYLVDAAGWGTIWAIFAVNGLSGTWMNIVFGVGVGVPLTLQLLLWAKTRKSQ